MLLAYPSITTHEFEEGSKALQQRFAAASHTADWLEVAWSPDILHIRQRRRVPQQSTTQQADGLKEDVTEELEEFEEVDEESIVRKTAESSHDEIVDYSIVLSPTYQVPVLWFSLLSVPAVNNNALDLVYKWLVLPSSRLALEQVGVLGGISIAEHPRSGLPAFFIHPCRTQEALTLVRANDDISPIEYLMLWFGVVPASIGLSIPSEIARLVPTQICGH